MSLVLNVEILGEYKKLSSATKGAENTMSGLETSIKKIGSGIGKTLAGIGVGFGAALASQIKPSIDAASDLGEATNAVSVAFGDAAQGIYDLGESASWSLGLSKTELYGIATQFSSFAQQVAGEGGDVVQVVTDIATRGADFASVFNLEVSDALAKFQSGLAGQTEPLRQYGIDLSAAAVEAYALEQGIWNGQQAMTEAEKVLGRYGLLMEETNITAGDFANTSDSVANQQRILEAEFENVQAKVGEALLPVMTTLLEKVIEYLPEIEKLIGGFMDFVAVVADHIIPAISALIGDGNGGFDGVGVALATLATAIGIFSATQLPLLFASNPIMAGAIAGLAVLAGGMLVVYQNTKKANDEINEMNRLANEMAVSDPFLWSSTGGALGYRGILDPTAPSTTAGSGMAGQSFGTQAQIDNMVSQNTTINVNVNRANLDAERLVDVINDRLVSVGSDTRLR